MEDCLLTKSVGLIGSFSTGARANSNSNEHLLCVNAAARHLATRSRRICAMGLDSCSKSHAVSMIQDCNENILKIDRLIWR